ncbi:Scd6-like Sm domain-containing protein [Irpex rosettiformis]|uniref:Scd6-like Sm domain-containing protein n=1 Tax=Irpex rosettiformis TaxID=378272 RepID=A0ACB8UHQ9_9APHY|nr:Scd6-like Sm domain-containing protein [Irpex rosettiformis]
MALSFIGKPISLISHSDVRYRGILAGIDPVASTIQLSNVFSMGTETRRPPEQFIPPVTDPYAYIIFRASEVKDLAVDEGTQPPPPRRNVHDDPAVLGASAPVQQPAYGYGAPGIQQPIPQPQAVPPQQRQPPFQQGAPPQQTVPPAQNGAPKNQRNNAVNSATASLETVERAIGDLRVDGPSGPPHGGRGGRRGGRHADSRPTELKVPATDFDFESSNARFDKSSLGPAAKPNKSQSGEVTPDAQEEQKEESDAEEKDTAYNPKKSFFDSLSSGSIDPATGGRGRGGRRGGGGRNRREEERERNVATFGEPGGIGLMGPGAYVGGWGGYGRRGGGRGRRGGGPGANPRQ